MKDYMVEWAATVIVTTPALEVGHRSPLCPIIVTRSLKPFFLLHLVALSSTITNYSRENSKK